ncbi:SET and MYND domain-containing protein 4 isoform X1 [Monomorium pharaonis]|uniref:SET and MYND domain-containing protein 4 isoform X1 n=1 Tax=Monomorium pharaonis TaxID=307658 RepID=UPI001746DBB5|nr:SET and MYND domain-containing protein 4 isoform X1 [Monomorium pharaonis]XP_036149802.1 SET and MYND domain-containing protein 4 isoform X1 [Monomorium pharaonis]XP_036149803.1 SET and MYND domain-containing protein 4 isoform X1 [Monomorium pharaonis]XP_036149804.1 SET and MYND domain-containing protein 4 isoform X1 [Monomorium pharaonis]XP_036149805.1 SET and MYND domain-containing protein 4 isoform X1 [Monomorium pharaonis]
MEIAKELVLTLKQNNKSHVGYGLQKECEALVGHILQNMVRSQMPPLHALVKNEEDSIRYREEGNQHFVMGDDLEAIECYTLSLAYADSNELMAYAYANRSAALYRKQLYKECLIDIDAALSHGYPKEKQKNLKDRGDKAITEIKKLLKLDSKDVDYQKTTNESYLCDSIERSLTKPEDIGNGTIKNGQEFLQKQAAATDEDYLHYASKIFPQKPRYLQKEDFSKLTYGPSQEVPAVSDGVVISFSEKYGRHYVATREFKPGDIVSIEDPYAHVIYEERYYTHCHYCLSRSYNLIPCSECPLAQYCSENCRKLAWKTCHEIECPILKLLTNLLNVDKDKIRMISKIIRLLIVITENGTKIKELQRDIETAESNSDNRTAGFTDTGILDSFSTRSALSLATNMTTRPLIGISAFACISALAVILLATQTKFFPKKYEIDDLKDISEFSELKFCASIMFRACVIMSSNCFSIQQEPGIVSGSGLYVAHSLYNHSCAPNTFRHFEGLTMITRVLIPIHPGDQIFTSYGGVYAHMSRAERKQKILQDYFLDCNCPACEKNWPTYNEILRNHVGSISKNKQLVEKLKPFRERLLVNMYDIEAVKTVLDILYKEVSEYPCEEILHAEQYLKSYYLGKFK